MLHNFKCYVIFLLIINKDAINKLCWSPLDSAGVWLFRWIPLDSAGVQWTCSAEKVQMDSTDSAGICWFPVDSAGLLPE